MAATSISNHKSKRHTSKHCDALIIGGGPAGLAAGIALRQQGLAVVVVDARLPPIDKACGEGLMPDSRRELASLGVDLDNCGGREFSGIHFANRSPVRNDRVTAEFPHDRGMGMRRVELHRRLAERAGEIGVVLKWGTRVGLGGLERRQNEVSLPSEVTIGGELCRYRYLVGADGESSRLRQLAGLESGRLRSKRFGFRRHYRMTPWSPYVEVHWGEFGQAYVTPVAEDEVCVAAVTHDRGFQFDRILEGLPALREHLAQGRPVGPDRGGVTTTRTLDQVTRRNIVLIGDASGSVDAITGEGLALAFREALLLGNSLSHGRIEDYEAGHRKILKRPQQMALTMLAMDRWPIWRNRVVHALAGSPDLFAGLLAVHVGELSPARFAAAHGIELAVRMLKPASARSASASTASQGMAGGAESSVKVIVESAGQRAMPSLQLQDIAQERALC